MPWSSCEKMPTSSYFLLGKTNTSKNCLFPIMPRSHFVANPDHYCVSVNRALAREE